MSPDDLVVLTAYRDLRGLWAVADDLDRPLRSVGAQLVRLLFGLDGDIDDATAARNHGRGYAREEREDLFELHHAGYAVPDIAEILGRTPLAIGMQVLSESEVPIPDHLRALLPPEPEPSVRAHAPSRFELALDVARDVQDALEGASYPRRRWLVREERELLRAYPDDASDRAWDPRDGAVRLGLPLATVVHRLVDLVLDLEPHGSTSRWPLVPHALDSAREAVARCRAGEPFLVVAARLGLHRDVLGALVLVTQRPRTPPAVIDTVWRGRQALPHRS